MNIYDFRNLSASILFLIGSVLMIIVVVLGTMHVIPNITAAISRAKTRKLEFKQVKRRNSVDVKDRN